jgi:hypothetical protein
MNTAARLMNRMMNPMMMNKNLHYAKLCIRIFIFS